MVSELQAILPEGEALILFELGTEAFRYLVATATIITRDTVEQLDLIKQACETASEIIGDPLWETQIDN